GGVFNLERERDLLFFERRLSFRAVILRPCCCRVSLALLRAVIKLAMSSRVMKAGG
ncbi:hypothetical protein A2U01_0116875, partial [Trifolium medium]|nr:hypothetical protein [Trifolium medium]